MERPDEEMTHIPRGTERGGARLHHADQNGAQLTAYEQFIPEVFPFSIFGPQLTTGN